MGLKAALFPDRMYKVRAMVIKEKADKLVELLGELQSFEPAEPKVPFGRPIEWARHDLLVILDHLNKFEQYLEYFELSIFPEPEQVYKFKSWKEASEEAIRKAKEVEKEFEERLSKIKEIEGKIFELSALLSKPQLVPGEAVKKLKEIVGDMVVERLPRNYRRT